MFDMTLFSPRGMMIGLRGHTSTQGFEQVLQNRDMTSEVAASQATGFGEIIKGPKWPKLWSTVNTRWRPPSFACLFKKYRNYSTYTVPTIVYHKPNSEILCRDARTNSRRFRSIPNFQMPQSSPVLGAKAFEELLLQRIHQVVPWYPLQTTSAPRPLQRNAAT